MSGRGNCTTRAGALPVRLEIAFRDGDAKRWLRIEMEQGDGGIIVDGGGGANDYCRLPWTITHSG
jgi:hypothetical protein